MAMKPIGIVGVEQTNISGIVLHVDEYGDQPSETLTFHKSDSRTIAVGRKSSAGNKDQHDPERALFRCPVVSRKHAKITFTEYGNVYITDLHSHHGTHVLRPGELVSTSLKPEVPTVLANGDLITFGKSVGRDAYLVRPVVVRIELVFGGDAPSRASSPLPGLLKADVSSRPAADNSEVHEDTRDTASPRSPTGRYGVFPLSPDMSSSSSSDGDSDVQEISPPVSPRGSPPSFSAFPGFIHSSNTRARFQLLSHILPPIHIAHSPKLRLFPSSMESFPFAQNCVVDEEDMDLSSSRASSHSPRSGEVTLEEPPIIGAWPETPDRHSEPREGSVAEVQPPTARREVIEISDDDSCTSNPDAPASASVETSEEALAAEEPGVEVVFGGAEPVHELSPPPLQDNCAEGPDLSLEAINGLFRNQLANASIPFDASDIEAQIADTRNELNIVRASRNKDEVVFTAHVEQTKARLDALDVQMQDATTDLTSRNEELSAIDARLEALKTAMTGLQEQSMLVERVEELMKEVGAAKDMLQETCEIQHQTWTQVTEELEALKALRAEAAAAVAGAKLACTAMQTQAAEPSNPLKRKRDDAEDEERAGSDTMQGQGLPVSTPKRRRTLRIVSTIAQTATIASLGAVAAWSALAFS